MDHTKRCVEDTRTRTDRHDPAVDAASRAIDLDEEELKHVSGGQVTPIVPRADR